MIDLAHLNSPDKTESAAMCHPPVTHKEVPLAPPWGNSVKDYGDYARKMGVGGLCEEGKGPRAGGRDRKGQ